MFRLGPSRCPIFAKLMTSYGQRGDRSPRCRFRTRRFPFTGLLSTAPPVMSTEVTTLGSVAVSFEHVAFSTPKGLPKALALQIPYHTMPLPRGPILGITPRPLLFGRSYSCAALAGYLLHADESTGEPRRVSSFRVLIFRDRRMLLDAGFASDKHHTTW